MISAPMLAIALAAAGAETSPSVRVFLKAAAASAPGCRTTAVDAAVVRAGLFAPEAGECPIAKVGDEAIPLRELAASIDRRHMTGAHGGAAPAKRGEIEFAPVLERIISARLIVQEAREMQLDEGPELRADLERHKASRLRGMLSELATRGVKPDAAEVERLYRDAVREWKIASVFLYQEQDAKALHAALKAGGRFEALAEAAVAAKKARGDGKAQFVSRKHMLPEILAAVQGAKQGALLDPVKIAAGWVVLRTEGVRYPKDLAARADASARSLARMQNEAIRRFYRALVKKHAVVDEALLKQLDFEAGGEKGFEALSKDRRTLVTIRGEAPITVADLTAEVGSKFFHGIASPIEQHRVNRQKGEAFERLLGMRLFLKEAAARKLEQRPEYLREVEAYERALLFGDFVAKVIAPEVTVTEAEVTGHYEKNKAGFTGPQMYKLDGIAFAAARDAEAALASLKGGTEFGWLRNAAGGQVPAEKRTLPLDGRTVSAGTLPPALAAALTGARAGEYRLYAAGAAETYVLKVLEQTPPETQPLAAVRDQIIQKLREEKLARGIAEYSGKLRAARGVEVLIARVAP